MISQPSTDSVVVVGGGVIGLACAHYLLDRGHDVTVIDRGPIGGACSLGNCGYICPSHVLPLTEPAAIRVALKSLLQPSSPFRVKPTISPAMWRWMYEFGRRCTHRHMLQNAVHLHAILLSSMQEYRLLAEKNQVECEWSPSGLLYVMSTEHGMEEFAKTDRLLTEHFAVTARRIDGTELSTFDPAIRPGMAGAFLYEGDAHLNPGVLVENWSIRLRDRGARLIENSALTDIQTSGGRVTTLQTTQGELPVDRVVIATGAWSPQLSKWLRCPIPIQPGKGYSVTTTRPDPCPQQAMLFPEHRVGVTPFHGSYRIGSMMEFVGYDETIPEARIQQLRTAADRYLLPSAETTELTRWYGWRPMTWDSLPIIGKVPKLDNAYLATGHNMLGMSLATATGKLIAELIAGEQPHLDVRPYSPARFAGGASAN